MSGNEPKRVRFCGTCVRRVEQAMIVRRDNTSLYGLKAMPTAFVKKFGKTR
ncbi:MAG: hypothetical protein H0W99_04330 [Acidobacteria bacterium]|nr:hypothetical protein [Acidobacteriota bacterium]